MFTFDWQLKNSATKFIDDLVNLSKKLLPKSGLTESYRKRSAKKTKVNNKWKWKEEKNIWWNRFWFSHWHQQFLLDTWKNLLVLIDNFIYMFLSNEHISSFLTKLKWHSVCDLNKYIQCLFYSWWTRIW